MRKTVAVDLDGVLADYSKGWQGLDTIGEPRPGAVEFTEELSREYDVLIFTTRCCEDMAGRKGYKAPKLREIVQEWLDKYGFEYADIYIGQGKPIASAYVDDRAVPIPMNPDEADFTKALQRVKKLCQKSHG